MNAIFVSAQQVREVVSMSDAIAAVRTAFIGLSRGDFEMPTRTALADGRFLIMSVHHLPTASAVIKALSLNFGERNPAIVGTVTWSDLVHTGHVIADAAAVTALRTGAASGVATDLLAPLDATHLVVVGAGGQASDQVRAVQAVRPLSRLTIVDRDLERGEVLAGQLAGEFPNLVTSASNDANDAVTEADIVCCATTATEPLFALESLKPNVHINAIGAFRPSMKELPEALLADAGVVYIDEKQAVLEESGEVIEAIKSGAITESSLTEIGTALVREPQPRRPGRTVFKTVGVAVQDWAIARLLAERFLD